MSKKEQGKNKRFLAGLSPGTVVRLKCRRFIGVPGKRLTITQDKVNFVEEGETVVYLN